MDVAEVKQLKTELEAEWSSIRGLMRECLSLYDLTYLVPVKKGFTPYHPPTAPRIVDTAIDHIVVGNEVITVPPRKKTQEAEEQADKLERFYKAVSISVDRELPEPLLRSLGRDALKVGLGVAKGPFWDEKVPDKPARGKGERLSVYREKVEQWERERQYINPIILGRVDPLQVLFPMDIFPPPFVIETGERTARYIRETWGLELAGKKDTDKVEWLEYWDKEQRLFLAGGESVLKESAQQNIGGFIPYNFVYSGLGRGGVSSKGESQSVAIRSILEPVLQALKQEATLVTALDVIVQLHAYPQYVLPRDGLNLIDWGEGPGGVITAPEGYKLTLLEMPHALPDMYNRLNMLRKEIEDATFSGVVQGQAPPGIEAGYPLAILIGQARMKFGALIGNLERVRGQMLGNTAKLIETLDETISVWAKVGEKEQEEKVRAKDINGHYEVRVALSGVSPEEADRRGMLGINYRKGGEISHQTFLEKFAMLPDATSERERILVEQLLESPEIKQVLSQEALKSWADQETLKAVEEAQKLQEQTPTISGQGVPGPGGGMVGDGGSGLPGLSPAPPGVPQRPIRPGSPEALSLWQRRLKRLGGTNQSAPIGGPREEVK